jgi:hypothetical protein
MDDYSIEFGKGFHSSWSCQSPKLVSLYFGAFRPLLKHRVEYTEQSLELNCIFLCYSILS